MINQHKILALILARGGSKGLPGKNIRPLAGLPLIAWPIKAALGSRYIDKLIVSTDDSEIARVAREHGAELPFMRPAELAKDTSPSSEAILHALQYCEEQKEHYDYFVLLEPTSPLTESADIDKAIEQLIASRGEAIVGACQVSSGHPIYCATIGDNQFLKPYQREHFDKGTRRQDIEPLYFFEGSLYISSIKKYQETHSFYHEKTLAYIVPEWKSLEVDTLLDFLMIETVLHNKALLTQE